MNLNIVNLPNRPKEHPSTMSNPMKKGLEMPSKVESWYPSAEEIVRTQREQVLKSRQEAVEFASQKSGKAPSSWWRRLFGMS